MQGIQNIEYKNNFISELHSEDIQSEWQSKPTEQTKSISLINIHHKISLLHVDMIDLGRKALVIGAITGITLHIFGEGYH